jgi:hypothetical protein
MAARLATHRASEAAAAAAEAELEGARAGARSRVTAALATVWNKADGRAVLVALGCECPPAPPAGSVDDPPLRKGLRKARALFHPDKFMTADADQRALAEEAFKALSCVPDC